MGRIATTLDERTRALIEKQKLFFVATAPLGGEGHVNCSPKGLDSFRVLDDATVAYLDFVGSGAETLAHLRQNGRICVLFCAFEGAPKVLRLQGRGSVVEPGEAGWAELLARFEPAPRAAVRAVICVALARVAESCGYGVPLMSYEGDRKQLEAWAGATAPEGIADYQREKNGESIDGLPALKWVGREKEPSARSDSR